MILAATLPVATHNHDLTIKNNYFISQANSAWHEASPLWTRVVERLDGMHKTLIKLPLDWLYASLSSPPVAGVWWGHWCRCPVAAAPSSKWMLHTGGGWGETPNMIVKCFGCTAIHNKKLHKCIIHSFINCLFLFLMFPFLLLFEGTGCKKRCSRKLFL